MESFHDTHAKVMFYWKEGRRIVIEEKDFTTGINLIIKAWKIVNESNAFPETYKEDKKYSFFRSLSILALKADLPVDSLKYAKISNNPTLIADAYFANGQMEKCLQYFMARSEPYMVRPGWEWQSEKIPRNNLSKVAKAFYYLNLKYPDKFNPNQLKEKYKWLYDQVVERFGSLEDAFSYCKTHLKTKTKPIKQLKDLGSPQKRTKKYDEALEIHLTFKKIYFESLNNISGLLNNKRFKEAQIEVFKLYEAYKRIETETRSIIVGNIINVVNADLITDITELLLLNKEYCLFQ